MASLRYHPYKVYRSSGLHTPPPSSSPPPDDLQLDSPDAVAVSALLSLRGSVQANDEDDESDARTVSRYLLQPFPPPRRLQKDDHDKYRGYFTKVMALKRAHPEYETADVVQREFADGVFRETPHLHPVYQSPVHVLFRRYDLSINMNAHHSANQQLKNYDSDVGRVIRAFNSTFGICRYSWEKIVNNSVRCSTCLCCFSAAGFLDHLEGHQCQNWYQYNSVPDELILSAQRKVNIKIPEERYFPALYEGDEGSMQVRIPLRFPGHDCPIEPALMEWNSRVGVPFDVWEVLTVAHVYCGMCGLFRSLKGHEVHLEYLHSPITT